MNLIGPIDYAAVFDNAGVALLVEDATAAVAEVHRMRQAGVSDVVAALSSDLSLAGRIAAQVQVLAVNDAALELFGASSGTELFGALERVFVPDSLTDFAAIVAAFADGERTVRTRSVNARLDGELMHVEVIASAAGEAGDYSRVVVALRDISAQRELDVQARRANEFLDAVVENIPHMVFVKDARELRFVRFNRAGEELLGVPAETMHGKSDYDFFPKEQAEFFVAQDRAVLDSGKMRDIAEEPIDTLTGRRWLHTKKVPIYAMDGTPAYLLGISEDITVLREVRRQLGQRTRDLERSNRELQQFAYVASHDLNEPLRTIRGFAELLSDELGDEVDENIAEILGFLTSGVERMQSLIGALLELSRVGGKAHQIADTPLADTLNAAVQNLALAAGEARAAIIYESLPTVPCDEGLITRVFQNLLSNAIKFREPDRQLEVNVVAIELDDAWRIEVRDNGIGFDNRFSERVFQIFQRLHARGHYEGAGIGLSVSKRIIEDHGGSVGASGTPGQGSVFHFTLPKTGSG